MRDPGGGPAVPVRVRPEDFHAVAQRFGDAVVRLSDFATNLHGQTSAAAGIAGVDDGAKQFDGGYQQALNTLYQGFDRATNVLADVAFGIDLSGYNHWNADASATPSGGGSPPWNLVDTGPSIPLNLTATSLVGNAVLPLPAPLDAEIPLGHHALLQDLAEQFGYARDAIENVRLDLGQQLTDLFENNSSQDLDAMNAFWDTIGGSSDKAILTALRDGCDQLSTAVSDYAGWMVNTQDEIFDQIMEFTGKLALSTAVSLVPALLTDGLGAVPALVKVLKDAGEFDGLVAAVATVDAAAAGRLASGVLTIVADTNTAMSAAINTTPNPNVDPANPQNTPTTPSDAEETQAAEKIGNAADGQLIIDNKIRNLPSDIQGFIRDAVSAAKNDKIRWQGHDGAGYENTDGKLPQPPNGIANRDYYTEWTVAKVGGKRGTMRLVIGGNPGNPDAIYYTDDHYTTFQQIFP